MPRPLRRVAAISLLLAVVALAFALPASAAARKYLVSLSGAAERPILGDSDAAGIARLTVNSDRREVCWSVTVKNVDLPLTAAHIHQGDPTIAGPPVVFLIPAGETDADGVFSGCATVDGSLARALLISPDQFYVNVHNAPFPGGAARGQLG